MASKRRIRRNACGNKRRYAAKDEALAIAMRVKRETGTSRFVSAYRCKWCNNWHWGNS